MAALIPVADPAVWHGCRLATAGADYWHAAYDFAESTLCGIPLEGSGMSETSARDRMTPHAACLLAAAAEKATADDRTPPLGDV